jgi:hypothetical protein
MGYHRAGFDVVGVDIEAQPSFPFEFHQANAFEVLQGDVLDLEQFDAIHASPPCQGYSLAVVSDGKWTHHSEGINTPRLIEPTRFCLEQLPWRPPYVIENVAGAKDELLDPMLLCGSMFNRPTPRHRWFETSFWLAAPDHPKCHGMSKRYAQEHGIDYRDMSVTGKSRRKGSIDVWREIMDMPWAVRARDLSEAIYPAYTEFIGNALLELVNAAPCRALTLPPVAR